MVSPWRESGILKMTNLGKNLGPLQPVQGGEGALTLHLQVCPSPGVLSGESKPRGPSKEQRWEEQRVGTRSQGGGTWEPWRRVNDTKLIPPWLKVRRKSASLASWDVLHTFQPTYDLLQDLWSQAGQRKGDGSHCGKSTKQWFVCDPSGASRADAFLLIYTWRTLNQEGMEKFYPLGHELVINHWINSTPDSWWSIVTIQRVCYLWAIFYMHGTTYLKQITSYI